MLTMSPHPTYCKQQLGYGCDLEILAACNDGLPRERDKEWAQLHGLAILRIFGSNSEESCSLYEFSLIMNETQSWKSAGSIGSK